MWQFFTGPRLTIQVTRKITVLQLKQAGLYLLPDTSSAYSATLKMKAMFLRNASILSSDNKPLYPSRPKDFTSGPCPQVRKGLFITCLGSAIEKGREKGIGKNKKR
jgi:hypothetical protein